MRTQMMQISRCAFLILLAGFLISSLTLPSQADVRNVSADFIKCDSLLGKSPQAVLAVLGPPNVTRQLRQYDDSGHLLEWEYQGSLELIFSNKALLVVDVETTKSQDDLRAAFKTCNPSLLKMTYLKGEAERVTSAVPTQIDNGLDISVTGTTRNGHLLTAKCKSLGDPPLIHSQVMNQNTNVYEDKWTPNPSFVIRSIFSSRIILSEGKGDLYEHFSWTIAEASKEAKAEKSSPARRGLMNLLSMSVFSENAGVIGPFVVTRLTSKNSPWLFQP